jgi:hypothetical protein
MRYTLIDKNEIIPKIINGDIELLILLGKNSINKNINYCKNTYVIEYGDHDNIIYVYFSDGVKLYMADDDGVLEYPQLKQCSQTKVFENMCNFLEKRNIKEEEKFNNMNIEITLLEEYDKSTGVLNECEKMYDIYQKELDRKKKIDEDLKIEEKNEKELLKKKRHMIQEKIIILKGNYRTFKNIQKEKLKNINLIIPETFNSQYEYFEKMDENNINIIDNLDDLEIMNLEIYNENVILLSNNFYEKINELKEKLSFTHNWSELDNEYKTGSYSLNYK